MSSERSNPKVKRRLPRIKRMLARLKDDQRLAPEADWRATADADHMVVIQPIYRPQEG